MLSTERRQLSWRPAFPGIRGWGPGFPLPGSAEAGVGAPRGLAWPRLAAGVGEGLFALG